MLSLHIITFPQELLGQILVKRNIRYWLNTRLFNFDAHKGLTVNINIILVYTATMGLTSDACWFLLLKSLLIKNIIIHQTHYEKSDWSREFIQFTIACELDMINAISAADIAFIMSSSRSAWLLSPLEFSPQKQNSWMLRFCFGGWIMWKMYNKTIIEFGFRMISWVIKTSCLCYLPQPSASADNSWYHAQPHPILNCLIKKERRR